MDLKAKIISALMAVVVFIVQPIWVLLVLIFVICLIDLLTALMKSWKDSKVVGFWNKVRSVKSRKLRRTSIKIMFYWIIITLFYAIIKICVDAPDIAIWGARTATLIISIHEIYSVGENMSGVTSNNIFNKIIRGTIKKLNEKVNGLIETDDEKKS